MKLAHVFTFVSTIVLYAMGISSISDSTDRIDADGLILEALTESQSTQSANHDIPEYFVDALKEFLTLPVSKTLSDIDSVLKILGERSIRGVLESDCGICAAFAGFLASLSNRYIPVRVAHRVIAQFPGIRSRNFPELLYFVASEYGSTFGVLGFVKNVLAHEDPLDDTECINIANAIGLHAREAASVDVFDELLAPHALEFDRSKRPRDRISYQSFDDDTTDVHYFISLMKKNAQALSSALLFGVTDLADMLGIDPDDVNEADIIESVERLSVLDDEAIAEELLVTINSIRHNTQVIKFNEGLELYGSSESCGDGLRVHHSIVGEQSLFAKMMFYFLKKNFYDDRNVYGSLLISTLLSDIGIESGFRNLANLLGSNTGLFMQSNGFPDSAETFVMLPTKDRSCSDGELLYSATPHEEYECLDICVENSLCLFARFSNGECFLYAACLDVLRDSASGNVYSKTQLSEHHPCWPPSVECLVQTHEQLAGVYQDLHSMNWLARHFHQKENFVEALLWAERSASEGDAEGIFFTGYLELKAWPGHPSNIDMAVHSFQELLRDLYALSILPSGTVDVNENVKSNIDDLEFESARMIAEQLGIHDIGGSVREPMRHGVFIKVLSGLYGLGIAYMADSPFLIESLLTGLAAIPIVAIVFVHRIYIV